MKKINLSKILALVLTAAFIFGGCGQNTEVTSASDEAVTPATQENEDNGDFLTGKHHVNITIEDKGTISVELDADVAPITVTNFVNLAKEGFYDGVVFHRIIEGFMMQGGDPTGTGTGGSEKTIKGEFAVNGVENNLSHVRGAISMARSKANDSASSQFFYCARGLDFFGWTVCLLRICDSRNGNRG